MVAELPEHGSGMIRAAVIGLGAIGRHHVRVYGEVAGVELAAVADVSEDVVARTVRNRHFAGFTDVEELVERARPTIATVAVPTSSHHDVVLQLVERGVHVLVEKPIATSVAEARSMIAAAARHDVRLMVGHIERFNPAIVELKRRIAQAGAIYHVSARRVGPFPDRIRDVGVVVDLASHDIDAMRFLLERPVERLYAETARRIHTAHEDMIVGSLRFAGGTIGSLDVNWLTPTKIRELSVVGQFGTFVANYLTQDLAFYENSAVDIAWDGLATLKGISEGNLTRYSFPRKEPLRAEIESFVEYVRDGGDCPASPEDATEALAIALDLIESARTRTPVNRLVDHLALEGDAVIEGETL